MTWESFHWRSLDERSLPAAAPLAEAASLVRDAIQGALAALAAGPVTLTGVEVAELRRTELPDLALPLASVEVVGAPRRQILVAGDPAAEIVLGHQPAGPAELGGRVLRAVDEAIAAFAGEGLGLGAADAATIPPDAELVAVRIAVAGEGGLAGRLVFIGEAAAVGELAAHVAALRALGAASEESEAKPGDGSTPSGNAAGRTSAEAAAAEPVDARKSAPTIRPAVFPDLGLSGSGTPTATEPGRSIDLLLGVQLQVSVEIGRTKLPIREVLNLGPGSIVELDKLAGEKADILVNGHPVAQGEVVVVDENFGVRITDVVSRQRRILSADGAP